MLKIIIREILTMNYGNKQINRIFSSSISVNIINKYKVFKISDLRNKEGEKLSKT